MVSAVKVTDYFSGVLRRGQLDAVTFSPDSTYVTTPRTQLETGALTGQDTALLFAAHRKTSGARPAASGEQTSMQVVVSLVSLSGRRGEQHGLLLLMADLFPDGHLEPVLETASSPWIPADRLTSPAVTDLEVMVGSFSAFAQHARSELGAGVSQTESFAEALHLATTLFEKVCDAPVRTFAARAGHRGHGIRYQTCYVQEYDRISAVGALLDVYDFLHRHRKAMPALVSRMTAGWAGPRTPESAVHDGNGLLRGARASCGSMSDEHPLTASQRRAVHAFLDDGPGREITAVGGPPGTGKTTMLQSVVAGLITRRALDEADPPVIVGTSTNNQAVTNIITSFGSVAKDQHGPLDFRWLPQEADGRASEAPLRSLAVYCPAKGKLRAARQEHLVEQTDKSETYTAYSNPRYLGAARDRFVRSAGAFFGDAVDVAGLQRLIHDALKEVERHRLALIKAMTSRGRSFLYPAACRRMEKCRHLGAIAGVAGLKSCTSLEQLDEKLDVTLRYAEFWLAVHYFEAAWLLAEDDFLAPDERWKKDEDILQLYWRQAAALTPCFVMTVYQVPKYFEVRSKPDEPKEFDVGRIDLLIVDEAGQVDTPLALPAFALASRALVVGDEKQLSPVWSIDEATDREVADGAGIPENEWKGDLQPRGLTCSATSSLMRAAAHASRWSYGRGLPGLFLSEHFRCHPDIIGFCNALLYDGLLEPRRPAEDSRLNGMTPAFLFKEVPGSHDAKRGSSRANGAEASAVAAWVVQHYARLFSIYNTEEPDPNKKVGKSNLIGVVTPFAAQARLITRELEKAATAPDAPPDLPSRLWTKIKVGTAHRLQGAERPVILFSAAYGDNSAQASFIDANPELMNVAVSRAQDLLVVFAAGNRWNNGKVFSVMSEFARRVQVEPAPSGSGDAQPTDLVANPGAGDDAGSVVTLPSSSVADHPVTDSAPISAASAAGPVTATASAAARAVTLTSMIGSWRNTGNLRDEDVGINARGLNLRLRDIGILEGETGDWRPSKLARVLGVQEEERRGAEGSYTVITYSPDMRELLLGLYLDGKL